MIKDLVKIDRSYRRFYENEKISRGTLMELVDCARLTQSAANAQALKYRIVTEQDECDALCSCIVWASALPDWPGPQPGERPSAYIAVCSDLNIRKNNLWDEGIALEAIMLCAAEKGYGGCAIANFNKEAVYEALGIDKEKYCADLLLALGKPHETVEIVPVPDNGNTCYYRDANGVHCVPKRALEDILI